jgi:hypothetical protein
MKASGEMGHACHRSAPKELQNLLDLYKLKNQWMTLYYKFHSFADCCIENINSLTECFKNSSLYKIS